MTQEKVLGVIEIYRQKFFELGIGEINYPYNVPLKGIKKRLAHCHGMLDQMVDFIHEDRMEKTFRWLGFIQGVLWVCGIYTLDDLKDHNRPPESE